MQEWLKILVSVSVGVAIGTISALVVEPLKTAVQRHLLATTIRRVLHRELIRFEQQFRGGLDLTTPATIEAAAQRLAAFRPEAYESYCNSQRELFYIDEPLAQMQAVLERLKEYQQDLVQNRKVLYDPRQSALKLVRDSLALHVFSNRVYNRLSKKELTVWVKVNAFPIRPSLGLARYVLWLPLPDWIQRRIDPTRRSRRIRR